MNTRALQEEALFIQEEIERRKAGDPLYTFKPHDKQRPFIDSVLAGKIRGNWLIAANRSGKSDAGAYCGATLARFGDQSDDVKFSWSGTGDIGVRSRATSGWVSGLSFPLIRDSIQPKYFDNGYVPPGQPHDPFIPQREIEHWDVEGQVLRLKNGSLVGFKSADAGAAKYQAAEKDWVHMDEEHPRRIYEEIAIRVGARPLRFFCTATLLPPEGMTGGVTWIYTDIIKPWLDGKKPGEAVFASRIFDNPHIPQGEIDRLEEIYTPGSQQWRIRLNGEWLPGLSGTRAYPSFERSLNVRQQPPLNRRRPLCWIWDFNVAPLVSLVGQRDQFTFRIFKELILEEGSIPEMVDTFRKHFPSHDAEIYIYGDATGKNRHPQSKHDNYTVILNHMLSYGVPVRMKVPEANPAVVSRINAVNMGCRDEQGVSHIEIDPSASELIADMEEVLLANDGTIKKTSNRKDPYFKRTHTSDAFGYWITYEAPVKPLRNFEVPFNVPGPLYNFKA